MSDPQQWGPPSNRPAQPTWSTGPGSPTSFHGPTVHGAPPGWPPAGGQVTPAGLPSPGSPPPGNGGKYLLAAAAGVVAMLLVGTVLVLTGVARLGGTSDAGDPAPVALPSSIDGLTDAKELVASGSALLDDEKIDAATITAAIDRSVTLVDTSISQGYPGTGHAVRIYSTRTASIIAMVKVVRAQTPPTILSPALDIKRPEFVNLYSQVTVGEVQCLRIDTNITRSVGKDTPDSDPKNVLTSNCSRTGPALTVTVTATGDEVAGPTGQDRMVRLTNAVWESVSG